MWPVSEFFLQALAQSHTVTVRANAYHGTDLVAPNLLVSSGSIRLDAGSQVRRSLSGLTVVSPTLLTRDLTAVLDTYGTEVLLERGVGTPTGQTEYCPVGRFRIDTVTDDVAQPGAVSVDGSDVEAYVVDDAFPAPRTMTPGGEVVAMIRTLILESIPDALVWDETGSHRTIPAGVVYEDSRADAIDALARAIGAEVFADPAGGFRIRPVRGFSDAAAWTIRQGSQGVLLGGSRSRTRAGIYNVVVATGNATDGTTPVYAVAQDNDPFSPTYVGGRFRRSVRTYSSPLLKTTADCLSAAQSILATSVGSDRSLSLDTLVNPALEGGDRIDVQLPDGTVERHIIDGLSLSLSPSDGMQITTRAVGGG